MRMKYLFTCSLLVFGLFANAQRKAPDTISINYVKDYKPHGTNLKGYYIDDQFVESDYPIMLDPADVKDIKIEKNPGRMYILTKNPKQHHFLTLNEIAAKYLKLDESPRIYIVDQLIIRDISSYKIDEKYILRIEVLFTKDFEYLKTEEKPLFQVIRILLRTPENIKKASEIRIR